MCFFRDHQSINGTKGITPVSWKRRDPRMKQSSNKEITLLLGKSWGGPVFLVGNETERDCQEVCTSNMKGVV